MERSKHSTEDGALNLLELPKEGQRVRIIGTHSWSGNTGTVVKVEWIGFLQKYGAQVMIDGRQEICAGLTNGRNWEPA